MLGTSEQLDCFGWMYNEHFNACTDRCAVRFLCKSEVRKKLQELGSKNFEKSKLDLALKLSEPERALIEEKPPTEPPNSELVQSVIGILKEFGLTCIIRKAHLSFKYKKRCIFIITRRKALSCERLLRFVFSPKFQEFDPEFKEIFVSSEKQAGLYYAIFENLESLKLLLSRYFSTLELYVKL